VASAALLLAELFIRTDRFELALPLLEELPTGHASRTVVAHTNALAALAYRLVGRTEEAVAATGRAQATLERPAAGRATQADAEAFFKVELLLAEASLLNGKAGVDQARAVLSDAEPLLDGVDDVRLRTQLACLQGDLAGAAGNYSDAVSKHTAAYALEIRPVEAVGWEPEWYMGARSFSTNPFTQPPSAADCVIERQQRGVGAALLVRIAQDKAALASEDAADAFDTAIDAAVRSGQSSLLFAALTGKAALQRRAAIVISDSPDPLVQAVDVLEASRAQLRNLSSRVSASGLTPDAVYATLVKEAMARNDHQTAVRLAQRAKSRGLLEEMVSAGRGMRSHVEIVTRDRIRQLRVDLVRAMGMRTRAPTPETVARVHELEGQLASAYRRQLRRTVRGPRPAATPEQVAALATDGTVVLDYFCADDATFLTVAREGALLPTQRLPAAHPAEIRALLLDLADECAQRAEPYSLEQLGNMLLGPVAEIINGARRVLVIPHSIVHHVPFAALKLASGQHLIECCDVMYSPSAAVALSGNRVAESVEPVSSVALGIPAVTYLPLTAIGGVRDEVEELAKDLSSVRVIDGAVRSDLLELSGELNLLHVAAHGEFDADDPLLSRLYFADGPVYAYDLLGWSGSPRVVVLSGCETAMVELRGGDELFGLVRPFLAAGADSVVAGLWKVSDTATACLMKELYSTGVPAPTSTAAALCRAQRALLRDPSTRHVYFWAPWIAIGRPTTHADGLADV
jgi:CHAT domain-containing protein